MSRLYPGAAGQYPRSARKIVIVQRGLNATERHYLAPRLADCALPVVYWDILTDGAGPNLDDAYVIVVRYLDSTSLDTIRAARSCLAGVAWLLDDDLSAALRDASLPLTYRYRMTRFWWRFRNVIASLASEIWLSSDVLMERLVGDDAAATCFRIDPVADHGPAPVHPPFRVGDPVKIFYHGELTHLAECIWLKPVLEEVQRRTRRTSIEIIGHRKIGAMMESIPRCCIKPPMPWQAYRDHIDQNRGDIGLAPLVTSRFNQARSFVKYLEIVRHGGVGLFADSCVYRGVVADAVNGRLLAMEPRRWIDAIVHLAEDDAERRRMRAATSKQVQSRTPRTLARLVASSHQPFVA